MDDIRRVREFDPTAAEGVDVLHDRRPGGRPVDGARPPTASDVVLDVLDPDSPDARACLHAYFAELQERFDTGFDPSRSLLPDAGELRPPHGLFLVARLGVEPVGCAGLKLPAGAPAEIKRMWVAPYARNLGLARRLLSELESRAVAFGRDVLRLDTNRALEAAIGLYHSAGFREVPAFNDEPYAHHWFEKRISGEPPAPSQGASGPVAPDS